MNESDHPQPAPWRREIGAGATTFLTMAYITVVNPSILSTTGMPAADVFFATCVAAAAATLVMAFAARYPFALAPGMGLNAFFAFTVCGQLGVPWRTALAAVLLSGSLFLVLSVTGVRERLIAAVPRPLVRACAAGIGLFIAFIGFQHAGIVADHPETLLTLGDLAAPSTLTAVVGLALTAAFVAGRVPGAILLGIASTSLIAFVAGVAPLPTGFVQVPRPPTETLGVAVTSLPDLFHPELAAVVFTMLFVDLFDTMGTLLALGHATGRIGPDGRLPRAGQAFSADAVGTMVGALLGTSTVTTYIESGAGVVAGGRSGRTALVVAALFLLALPFYPLVAAVPSLATAPALVVVGALMFSGAAEIDWKDPVVALPSLATILIMPATYSISNGLGVGFVLFTISHLAARRFEAVKPLTYAVTAAFILHFMI